MNAEELKNVLDLHAIWVGNSKLGKRADLSDTDLSRADLRGANLHSANLRGADLSYANLQGANLQCANLCGANLCSADLCSANLRCAELCGADLCSAVLHYANLRTAAMHNAILCGAELICANLSSAKLGRADLRGAELHHVIGNTREIKSLQLDIWDVVYTHDMLFIGCQGHSIEAWRGFTDDVIHYMDDRALAWWGKWRDVLFNIIDISPAVAPEVTK